jgi:hypothetical protein
MEGAGKKQKRVVLMTKAKIVLSTRFLGTLRYVLSIIF